MFKLYLQLANKSPNFYFFFSFFSQNFQTITWQAGILNMQDLKKRISTITQNSFKLGKRKISYNFILQYKWTQEKKCEKAESELLLIRISFMYKLLSVYTNIFYRRSSQKLPDIWNVYVRMDQNLNICPLEHSITL